MLTSEERQIKVKAMLRHPVYGPRLVYFDTLAMQNADMRNSNPHSLGYALSLSLSLLPSHSLLALSRILVRSFSVSEWTVVPFWAASSSQSLAAVARRGCYAHSLSLLLARSLAHYLARTCTRSPLTGSPFATCKSRGIV